MSWLTDLDDEDDKYADYEARNRPNPKGNKPRTKIRPEHSDAVTGRVLTVDRGRYTVLIDEDGPDERGTTASRASELRKKRSEERRVGKECRSRWAAGRGRQRRDTQE